MGKWPPHPSPSTLLRDARKRSGMTQQELADRLRRRRPTIANWETGQHAPRVGECQEVEEALSIPAGELRLAVAWAGADPVLVEAAEREMARLRELLAESGIVGGGVSSEEFNLAQRLRSVDSTGSPRLAGLLEAALNKLLLGLEDHPSAQTRRPVEALSEDFEKTLAVARDMPAVVVVEFAKSVHHLACAMSEVKLLYPDALQRVVKRKRHLEAAVLEVLEHRTAGDTSSDTNPDGT